jgi:hypothetical protein
MRLPVWVDDPEPRLEREKLLTDEASLDEMSEPRR